MPASLPQAHYKINELLEFDLNAAAIQAGVYLAYYFALEPLAAVSHSQPA
jgi:hypothetical protein